MQSTSSAPARTVVITGASSGIGLAIARALASARTRLVLAARDQRTLEQAAATCSELGADVRTVAMDVSDADAVDELGATAIREFGGFDVWVNNAAVAAFGDFEKLPPEDVQRVVDINVMGYVHGAQTALRHFKQRGRGHLINMGSANGTLPSPVSTAYVLTKYAITGLSQALRTELVPHRRIHVSTIIPASIDTPLYEHAANYTGHEVSPAEPVFTPEQVAEATLSCIERPRAEIMVGWAGRAARVVHRVAPSLFERVGSVVFPKEYDTGRAEPPNPGNLHAPMTDPPRVRGGWSVPHDGPADVDAAEGSAVRDVSNVVTSAASASAGAVLAIGRMIGRAPRRPGARKAGSTAEVHATIDAPPSRVYEVLADASSYADWVVGARRIRATDSEWPAPGSSFLHTQGKPPMLVHDSTSVLEARDDERLLLEVRARPFLVAEAEFVLEPEGDGATHVTMRETPTDGAVRVLDGPVVRAMATARNTETLRRLGREVERRTRVHG